MLITTIGLLAGTGTTVSFFPQMVRIIRTGSIEDLSIHMFLIHSAGVCLWVVYGVLMKDLIIIFFNCVTAIFNLVILSYFISAYCKSKPSLPTVIEEI